MRCQFKTQSALMCPAEVLTDKSEFCPHHERVAKVRREAGLVVEKGGKEYNVELLEAQ